MTEPVAIPITHTAAIQQWIDEHTIYIPRRGKRGKRTAAGYRPRRSKED